MSGTFVAVPAEALIGLVEAVGRRVEERGGGFERIRAGREVAFEIRPPVGAGSVRVYTSVAAGAETARARGEDALRVVVGYRAGAASGPGWKPAGKARRVLRTAPRGADPDARVAAFLARVTEALRDAYRQALQVPACPRCGRAMARRRGPSGEFWGCTGYPACSTTRSVGAGGGPAPRQEDVDPDPGNRLAELGPDPAGESC